MCRANCPAHQSYNIICCCLCLAASRSDKLLGGVDTAKATVDSAKQVKRCICSSTYFHRPCQHACSLSPCTCMHCFDGKGLMFAMASCTHGSCSCQRKCRAKQRLRLDCPSNGTAPMSHVCHRTLQPNPNRRVVHVPPAAYIQAGAQSHHTPSLCAMHPMMREKVSSPYLAHVACLLFAPCL